MRITVGKLAKAIGAKAVGNLDWEITGPSEPKTAEMGQIALAMDPKYSADLQASKAKSAILWPGADWQALGLEAAIYAKRARYSLSGVTKVFGVPPEITPGIHPSAVIDPSARIGANAAIGAFVMIGRSVEIGKNARILSHVSICEDVVIGDDVLLHNGVRIGARIQIGNNFIANLNAAIGGDGFSFVTPEAGAIEEARSLSQVSESEKSTGFARINSLGTVIIGDDVEMGANSAIDRGTIADTTVGSGTKIDNLVQIGHNVQIGENCLLCGIVGVGGSTVIGNGVILGGQVGVADHVVIGDNVVAGGQSGIASNVPSNRTIMGSPAVKMETSVAMYQALRRLPRLMDKVDELQKQLSKLKAKN